MLNRRHRDIVSPFMEKRRDAKDMIFINVLFVHSRGKVKQQNSVPTGTIPCCRDLLFLKEAKRKERTCGFARAFLEVSIEDGGIEKRSSDP